jgi:LuxR family maltose regulon positive regulatory protein
MPELLLTTKFYTPPIPTDWVLRPRLIEKLDAGLSSKLTVVHAPAGFGKTTLLSSWIHCIEGKDASSRPRIAWLSLDMDDNDPIRFWTYFIAALQTSQADLGESCLKMLEIPRIPSVKSILATLINELAKEPQSLILVLDDYHVINAQRIHRGLAFLIDHLPPQIHLVIASRTDPPLLLAELRGRGQLNEISTNGLRFSLDEATTFFNEVLRLDLSNDNVAALHARTEGWITSLKMAAISMQGREDIPTFISTFSGTHRYIMDYLTEEVLRCQEASVQSFLLQTSILNRLSGPLCNAVTGQDGQKRLEQLEFANLFLIPLDDDRRWYRYHRLFAELLRSQLERTQPDLVSTLHKRASQWFEREGLADEAIHHALAAEDFEQAAYLIDALSPIMIARESKFTVLGEWLVKMPSEVILSRPSLCLGLAIMNLSSGKFDTVEPLLQTAESLLDEVEEQQTLKMTSWHAGMRGIMMGLRATLASIRGDISYTIELCQKSLKYLPEDILTGRPWIMFMLGRSYYMQGQLATASQHLDGAYTLSQEMNSSFVALSSLHILADIEFERGHLRRAEEINREAIRLGILWGGGEPLPATANSYLSLAQILYQRNEIEEAVYYVSRGIELCHWIPETMVALSVRHGLPLFNDFQGKAGTISQVVNQLEKIAIAASSANIADILKAWLARLSLMRGDLSAADRWAASQKIGVNLKDLPELWLEYAYLTIVRLHIAHSDIDGLPEILERLLQKAEAEERTGSVIEISILQAIALYAQSNIQKALNALEHALVLAEPEGYVRVFIDEGSQMYNLLRDAATHGIASGYVSKLLVVMRESGQRELPSAEQPLTEPLTERELQVLELIASGLSNRETAETLFVTEGTIKKHLNNIFGKLNVKSRTQVIERARQLKIL